MERARSLPVLHGSSADARPADPLVRSRRRRRPPRRSERGGRHDEWERRRAGSRPSGSSRERHHFGFAPIPMRRRARSTRMTPVLATDRDGWPFMFDSRRLHHHLENLQTTRRLTRTIRSGGTRETGRSWRRPSTSPHSSGLRAFPLHYTSRCPRTSMGDRTGNAFIMRFKPWRTSSRPAWSTMRAPWSEQRSPSPMDVLVHRQT